MGTIQPLEPSDNSSDSRRTRRNIIGMGSIVAASIIGASIVGANGAKAGGGFGGGGGGGGGFGGGDGGEGGGGGGGYGGGGRGEPGAGSCFLVGTQLQTKNGEMSVEDLIVGSVLMTTAGDERAVKKIHSWNATRERGDDWPADIAPIKVARSALAPNVPHRDLYLSPNHSLYVDGVLIRVGALVNGTTIVRCSKFEAHKLGYYHFELEDHQGIFAEGMPVESYLAKGMKPFAPLGIGFGRKSELASRLRSAVSPWVDSRKVFDVVRDRIELRAESLLAA